MKEIQLTQGKMAQVDDKDYEWLNQWKWYTNKSNSTSYARRDKTVNKRKKHIHMHREILKTPDSMQTDHIDSNGLNNQRNNLRICTRQQNNGNRKSTPNTSSLYKGVYWDKINKNWRANIRFNQKTKQLGSFVSEIKAARAYDKVALELFGKFAKININAES